MGPALFFASQTGMWCTASLNIHKYNVLYMKFILNSPFQSCFDSVSGVKFFLKAQTKRRGNSFFGFRRISLKMGVGLVVPEKCCQLTHLSWSSSGLEHASMGTSQMFSPAEPGTRSCSGSLLPYRTCDGLKSGV